MIIGFLYLKLRINLKSIYKIILELALMQYQSLWLAVILQATSDILRPKKTSCTEIESNQAYKWVFGNDKSFCEVCGYAGLDHERVRKEIKKSIKQGIKNINVYEFRNY